MVIKAVIDNTLWFKSESCSILIRNPRHTSAIDKTYVTYEVLIKRLVSFYIFLHKTLDNTLKHYI